LEFVEDLDYAFHPGATGVKGIVHKGDEAEEDEEHLRNEKVKYKRAIRKPSRVLVGKRKPPSRRCPRTTRPATHNSFISTLPADHCGSTTVS
jgi:hypothetical protein